MLCLHKLKRIVTVQNEITIPLKIMVTYIGRNNRHSVRDDIMSIAN